MPPGPTLPTISNKSFSTTSAFASPPWLSQKAAPAVACRAAHTRSRGFAHVLGGAVVYSDALKVAYRRICGLIEKHGAVSAEVAKALASGIRLRTGASIA